MASLNKGRSQKDILDDDINIIPVNMEQNDVCPFMSELTNATIMDLTQTSTKVPQMINTLADNEDERIALIIQYKLVVSSLFPPFSSPYKHRQLNRTELYAI